MADNPLWHETLHDHFGQYFSVDNVLYHEKTDHQDLIIFDNRAFGRVMALDGVVQTTERDEFIYHEMMTHVPLLAHGQDELALSSGYGTAPVARYARKDWLHFPFREEEIEKDPELRRIVLHH